MRNISTLKLYEYFNHVRGPRPAPYRSEIDPVAMKPYLSSVFMLGTPADGSFHFRLAGTRICHQKGRELRGENFVHLFRREAHHSVQLMLQAVAASQTGLLMSARDEDHGSSVEILCLPVLAADGQCNRILGLLHAEGLAIHQRLGRLHTEAMKLLTERANRAAPAGNLPGQTRILSSRRTFLTVHEGGRI